MEILEGAGRSDQCIECPDAVQLWGDVSDWHHAIRHRAIYVDRFC